MSHRQHSIYLVNLDFRNLMLGHVLDIVVVLNQSIGINTLLVGGSEAASENSRVLFIEENENSSKSDFFSGVFPEAFKAISLGQELHDS